MLGGGAVFFANNFQDAFLADQNEELINYYQILKEYNTEFIDQIISLKPTRDRYYELRNTIPDDRMERAIRFAYLNRLSWNGLYRVNRNGDFNVPFGGRTPKSLWSRDHLIKCSKKLQNVELACHDFLSLNISFKNNDLVFIDPPYPKGVSEGVGFNRYNANPFTIESHIKLSKKILELANKDVKVLLTLGDNQQILELYSDHFIKTKVYTKSFISCNGNSRGSTIEFILRNYKN